MRVLLVDCSLACPDLMYALGEAGHKVIHAENPNQVGRYLVSQEKYGKADVAIVGLRGDNAWEVVMDLVEKGPPKIKIIDFSAQPTGYGCGEVFVQRGGPDSITGLCEAVSKTARR